MLFAPGRLLSPIARSFALSAGTLLTAPDAFDNAAWVKTGLTVTANAGAAPDGTTTADLLLPGALGNQFLVQSVSFTSGVTYSLSVYAKASGFGYLRISYPSPPMTAGRLATVDLSSGAVQKDAGLPAATAVPVGGGWWLCTSTGTATSTASGNVGFAVNDSAAPALGPVAGNGSSGILLWRAQLAGV